MTDRMRNLVPESLCQEIECNGGGMVQSVIVCAEVVTAEGNREYFTMWDEESSVAGQIGLAKMMNIALEARMANIMMGFSDDTVDG